MRREHLDNAVKKRKRKLWLIPVVIAAGIFTAFLIYVSVYYHAEPEAYEALVSDEQVNVGKKDYGWFFDGPSETDLLIFYPGGKVEAAAYAPFMRCLAEKGMDACLVEMPFNLAVFGKDMARSVPEQYDYENCFIGGHSLGGTIAASYAAEYPGSVKGVILCAAYPTKNLPDSLTEITVYGSKDMVLNRDRMEEGKKYAPPENYVYEIAGGNHAGFGNYGKQDGDGPAQIIPEEQQEQAARFIVSVTGA